MDREGFLRSHPTAGRPSPDLDIRWIQLAVLTAEKHVRFPGRRTAYRPTWAEAAPILKRAQRFVERAAGELDCREEFAALRKRLLAIVMGD